MKSGYRPLLNTICPCAIIFAVSQVLGFNMSSFMVVLWHDSDWLAETVSLIIVSHIRCRSLVSLVVVRGGRRGGGSALAAVAASMRVSLVYFCHGRALEVRSLSFLSLLQWPQRPE